MLKEVIVKIDNDPYKNPNRNAGKIVEWLNDTEIELNEGPVRTLRVRAEHLDENKLPELQKFFIQGGNKDAPPEV